MFLDFFPCPAPPRPAEKRAAPSIPECHAMFVKWIMMVITTILVLMILKYILRKNVIESQIDDD